MATDPAHPDAPPPTPDIVEEMIARHLAPLVDLYPPDVLEEFAEEIRVFLCTHPLGTLMVSRTQPDERATSGGQASPGVKQDAPLVVRPKGKVG